MSETREHHHVDGRRTCVVLQVIGKAGDSQDGCIEVVALVPPDARLTYFTELQPYS